MISSEKTSNVKNDDDDGKLFFKLVHERKMLILPS